MLLAWRGGDDHIDLKGSKITDIEIQRYCSDKVPLKDVRITHIRSGGFLDGYTEIELEIEPKKLLNFINHSHFKESTFTAWPFPDRRMNPEELKSNELEGKLSMFRAFTGAYQEPHDENTIKIRQWRIQITSKSESVIIVKVNTP